MDRQDRYGWYDGLDRRDGPDRRDRPDGPDGHEGRDRRDRNDGPARPGWRIHGMSVEGYRHRRENIPCQDAWHSAVVGPPEAAVVVLAVADGAGSRPHSGQGAGFAVQLATSHFGQRAEARPQTAQEVHELLLDAFIDVREEFVSRTEGDPDDFASTLTVVVLAPTWLGHLSVGDGFVVVRSGSEGRERQFHLLPQPDAVSEYSNETVFLTSADAEHWVHTECVRDEGIDGVLLSTDGLTQAALSRPPGRPRGANASFASAVLRSLDAPGPDPRADDRALAELLRSDRLTAFNADDKTLLRAVRA
ncbi:PP2C family serine/threonine-protein phosphatase [Streptomyces sp. C36]|uniref:PP2C family serine/threonine-protein phosphatase n=1 Tax=Streptomyces sp. C36 TaxID=3237122 RepID=UPI0034C5E9CA